MSSNGFHKQSLQLFPSATRCIYLQKLMDCIIMTCAFGAEAMSPQINRACFERVRSGVQKPSTQMLTVRSSPLGIPVLRGKDSIPGANCLARVAMSMSSQSS